MENQTAAVDRLLDIVSDAGDDGFKTLVRALARNGQEDLARQLDKDLAERFITKPSPVARMSLFHCYHSYCS